MELRFELAIQGVVVEGITITRLRGVMSLASGVGVVYCCGWLLWPTGRLAGAGVPWPRFSPLVIPSAQPRGWHATGDLPGKSRHG